MTVSPDVSLACVRSELADASDMLDAFGLELDTCKLDGDQLRFRLVGESRVDGERYVVEFQCDHYRELPPFIEFIDPKTGEPGTKRAYPNCFHQRPCICARYNRKTYPEHTGLHGAWKYGDWDTDPETDHLGGMISHIWSHIHGFQGSYTGRQD